MTPSDSSTVVLTESQLECVSLELLKSHCRVVVTDEDALLASYLRAARELVERESGLQLLRRTIRHRLAQWPRDFIQIPAYPLIAVTSIVYIDEDGATQTLSTDLYTVDTDRRPGVIWRSYEESWPTVIQGRPDAITINCTVGYNNTDKRPPEAASQAILLTAAHWYRSPESVVIGTINSELEVGLQRLIDLLTEKRYP